MAVADVSRGDAPAGSAARRLAVALGVAALAATAVTGLALARPLILPTHTPGARYARVTQATVTSTICRAGWTATIRPPVTYTNALKARQLAAWRYTDRNPGDYEEDHLISLELGGAPRSQRNLWPQPWPQARADDRLENRWHTMVCSGTLTLRQAQALELAYKRAHG